jgi:NitT/TauT family transport system substrate-binding protein
MQYAKALSCMAVAIAMLLALPKASAEDLLKITLAERGAWELAAPELGQLAEIFKKHGIVLEFAYVDDDEDAEAAVISGTADVAMGIGIMKVLRAYAIKGPPVRIIGANMTGSGKYWYVPATSPIKTVKDISGKTIAYSRDSASNQYDVFDLMDRYRAKPRPVLTGGETAALDQVMSGKIDVGWATVPFGLDRIEQGQIRVVAKANDIPKIRDKTVSVMIANADALAKRQDAFARFLDGYRETLAWMYSDPAAPKAYTELASIPEGLVERLRNEFLTKEMLSPDNIVGLSAIMKDAAKSRYIWAPLSRKQLAELIQIQPQDAKASASSFGRWLRALSPR